MALVMLHKEKISTNNLKIKKKYSNTIQAAIKIKLRLSVETRTE